MDVVKSTAAFFASTRALFMRICCASAPSISDFHLLSPYALRKVDAICWSPGDINSVSVWNLTSRFNCCSASSCLIAACFSTSFSRDARCARSYASRLPYVCNASCSSCCRAASFPRIASCSPTDLPRAAASILAVSVACCALRRRAFCVSSICCCACLMASVRSSSALATASLLFDPDCRSDR